MRLLIVLSWLFRVVGAILRFVFAPVRWVWRMLRRNGVLFRAWRIHRGAIAAIRLVKLAAKSSVTLQKTEDAADELGALAAQMRREALSDDPRRS